MSQCYRVRLTDEAKGNLRRIGKKYGKKTYQTLRDLIQDLEYDAEQKGEPLQGQLRGLYSCHYSRFRVIYQIDGQEFVVLVIAAGWQEADSPRDVYRMIERAIESGRIVIERRDAESQPSDPPSDKD